MHLACSVFQTYYKENPRNEHWGTTLCKRLRNQHSYKLLGLCGSIINESYAKDEIKRIEPGIAAMANITIIMKDLGFDQH